MIGGYIYNNKAQTSVRMFKVKGRGKGKGKVRTTSKRSHKRSYRRKYVLKPK